MTDIDALAIELHKHLFVTVTDWRDEAGDWDSLGEQAKSEYRLVARRVRDMVTGPPMTDPYRQAVSAIIDAALDDNQPSTLVEAELRKHFALRTQCEVMAKALEAITSGDFPRPLGKRWRSDGKPSKLDRCIHDRTMSEDCGCCIDSFADAALQSYRMKGTGDAG